MSAAQGPEPTQPGARKRSRLVPLMRILGVLYAVGAALLFFFPNELIYLVNVGPRVFRITEAIPESSDPFWNLSAFAFVATLSAVSFLSSETPSNRGYLLIHQFAKAMMISGSAYFFLNSHHYFAYIVTGMTETFLFGIVFWGWLAKGSSS